MPAVGSPVITEDVAREVHGTHGQHIHIHCEASGQQPLLFQWFKKRDELEGQTRNTLTLQNVQEHHEGYYICRVANSFNYTFTSWAKVIVDEDYAAHGYSQFGMNRHCMITCMIDKTDLQWLH